MTAGVSYDELSLYLRVLGVPNRLPLLRKLQVPRTLAEIDLLPARKARDREATRPLSRNAVEAHLRRLQELGLVNARARPGDPRESTEYVVNHARLFVVTDEFRRVALQRTALAGATHAAEEDPVVDPPALPRGGALVLVNGPLEGRAFALDGDGPWIVGRERDADVALPYDPFVSRANTRVARDGDGFAVEALPARNGTRVNWRELPAGARARLVPGDVVAAGRSLLLFRAEGPS